MNFLYVIKKKFKRLFWELSFLVANNNLRIKLLKNAGVKIGKNCYIMTNSFSTEPYLIEIGNHVAIASFTHFITHDGSVWVFREKNPDIDVFGRITVGDNSVIGLGCIILPNTRIGKNCVIGAGSVVRGVIPDNSVVMGNPAKVILKTEIMEKLTLMNKNALNTKLMSRGKKDAFIKMHFGI